MAVRPLFNGSARVSVDNNPADPALLNRFTFRVKAGAAPATGDENIDNTTFQAKAGAVVEIFWDIRKFGGGAETDTPTEARFIVCRDDSDANRFDSGNLVGGQALPRNGSLSVTLTEGGTYWVYLSMRRTSLGVNVWVGDNDNTATFAGGSTITRRLTADKGRLRYGFGVDAVDVTERGNALPSPLAFKTNASGASEEAVRVVATLSHEASIDIPGRTTFQVHHRRNASTTIDTEAATSSTVGATRQTETKVAQNKFPLGLKTYDAVLFIKNTSHTHDNNTPQYSGLTGAEGSGLWTHFTDAGGGLTLEDFRTVAKLASHSVNTDGSIDNSFVNNTDDYAEDGNGVPIGSEDFSFIFTRENMRVKAGAVKNARGEALNGIFVLSQVIHDATGAVRGSSWGLDNPAFKTGSNGWQASSQIVNVNTPPDGIHRLQVEAYYPVSSLGVPAVREFYATRIEQGSPAGADAGKDWIAPASFTASIVIFKSPTKGGELNVVTIKIYDKAALKDADFDPPVKVYKNGSATLWASLVVTKRPGVSGVYDVFLTSDAVAAGESNFYEIAVEVTVGGFLKVFGATLTAIPFELPAHAHRAGDGSKLIEVPEMDQSGNPLF